MRDKEQLYSEWIFNGEFPLVSKEQAYSMLVNLGFSLNNLGTGERFRTGSMIYQLLNVAPEFIDIREFMQQHRKDRDKVRALINYARGELEKRGSNLRIYTVSRFGLYGIGKVVNVGDNMIPKNWLNMIEGSGGGVTRRVRDEWKRCSNVELANKFEYRSVFTPTEKNILDNLFKCFGRHVEASSLAEFVYGPFVSDKNSEILNTFYTSIFRLKGVLEDVSSLNIRLEYDWGKGYRLLWK